MQAGCDPEGGYQECFHIMRVGAACQFQPGEDLGASNPFGMDVLCRRDICLPALEKAVGISPGLDVADSFVEIQVSLIEEGEA